MEKIDRVVDRIMYQRMIKAKDTEAIGDELKKIQKRQRYLWNHGEDSDLPEYLDNEKRIEILSSEIRKRIKENTMKCRVKYNRRVIS